MSTLDYAAMAFPIRCRSPFFLLSSREHVELYASIKGIPTDSVKAAALDKLTQVGLSETDIDRLSSNYSGGMKRRLSLACATIGQPQLV